MNKKILFAIMTLLLLVTACNKNDDIEILQSLVKVSSAFKNMTEAMLTPATVLLRLILQVS